MTHVEDAAAQEDEGMASLPKVSPSPPPAQPAATAAALPDAAGEPPVDNLLIARMKVQADLTDESAMARGPERRTAVYEDLVQTAATSQVDALAKLGELKAAGDVTNFESLFLPNAIVVATKPGRHQAVTDALSGVANVSAVTENRLWSVQDSGAETRTGAAGAAAGAAFLAYAKHMKIGPELLNPSAGRAAALLVASGGDPGATGASSPAPIGSSDPPKDTPAAVSAPAAETPAPAAPIPETPAPETPAPTAPVPTTPEAEMPAPVVSPPPAAPAPGTPPPAAPPAPAKPTVAWGVERIGAPVAWAAGADGRGVTIGIVDTGLDVQHEAIRPHYRGTQADGSQVHDYNWFDAFGRSAAPFDAGTHGTHVAGSSAGGSETEAIGVAPGAKLIAARAINEEGYNSTAATLQALQFMLAPTRTDGSAPDPTKGADVINNSWGNVKKDDDTFKETFAALKAAGIEVVTAAGNQGPGDDTLSSPGSYPGHLTVAASTKQDAVADMSSRGPAKTVPAHEMTPNVTAPGVGIRSAAPGGGYRASTGTSMASPHVAGAVASILSVFPQATHDQIVEALTKTAKDIAKPGPDNAAGYGMIDLPAALAHLAASSNPETAS